MARDYGFMHISVSFALVPFLLESQSKTKICTEESIIAKSLNDSGFSPQICFDLNLLESPLFFPWFSVKKVSRVVNLSEKLGAWDCGCYVFIM